jgi:flagellar protein FliO/FliZ
LFILRGARTKKIFYKTSMLLFASLIAVSLFSPFILTAQDTGKTDLDTDSAPSQNIDKPSENEAGQTGELQNVPTGPDYEYEEPDFGENRISYPLLVLRTLAVLAVIIVGIYLLFRMLVKKRNRIVAETDIIKVLASYPLASNRLIQVVEIAGKIMILGVTDSNINLITEVEDTELIDKIKLLSSKESKAGGSFKDQFLKLIGGKGFQNPGQLSYFSNYKKRINKIKKL